MSKHNHQWHLLPYVSGRSKTDKELMNDEELDDNDLEVAMINGSFEEQLKHSLLFTNSNLMSIFYGSRTSNITIAASTKQSPDLGIDEAGDFKMEMTPPLSVLPLITPPLDIEEFERGRQLDRELDQMMLEGDDSYRFSFASPEDHKLLTSSTPPSLLPTRNNVFSPFESQLDDEQDSDESTKAAKSIAFDVVSSLFADEPLYSSESFSDDEESMVVNASILQVLQDDEIESELEDERTKEIKLDGNEICAVEEKEDALGVQPTFQSRDSSMASIQSPIYTSDEQTVPVFDSWEELGDSPVAAEKVYSEAKAVLRKIRAERRATQL